MIEGVEYALSAYGCWRRRDSVTEWDMRALDIRRSSSCLSSRSWWIFEISTRSMLQAGIAYVSVDRG